MMTWIVVALAALAVVLLVGWLSRPTETPLWHDATRSEVLRSELARRGLDARIAPKAPVPMPEFQVPLKWDMRSRAGAHAVTDGSAQWLLSDSDMRGRQVSGCNPDFV